MLALAMVSVAALGASVAPAHAAGSCAAADDIPTASTARQAMRATICLVNAARRSEGRRPVRSARGLRLAAEAHSRDMVGRVYFEHVGLDGRSLAERVRAAGYGRGFEVLAVGEAIGVGIETMASPRAMVDAWLASPDHRHILLHRRFREVGIGIETAVDGLIPGAAYTADFGLRRRPR